MKYTYTLTEKLDETKSTYDISDMSFDAIDQSYGERRTAAIVIGETLQLEFDTNTRDILHLWGYSPKESWIKKKLTLPAWQPGIIKIELNDNEVPQVGVGYTEQNAVGGPYFDEASGWVLLGSGDYATAIKVNESTILGLQDDKLLSVWVHPSFK